MNSRLLFFADCNAAGRHVLRKLDAQYNALRQHFDDSTAIVTGYGDDWTDAQDFSFTYHDLRKAQVPPRRKAAADAECLRRAIASRQPTHIFLRYPSLKGLQTYRALRGHVYFLEHHTNEIREFRTRPHPRTLSQEFLWGRPIRANARGIIAVTPDIAEYQVRRSGRGSLPWISVGNGIDPSQWSVGQDPSPSEHFRMILVANLSKWHGADRLLRGMATGAARRLHLDVVGTGEEYSTLVQLARRLRLTEQVTFHGYVDGAELDGLMGRADLAVGSLAGQRVGLRFMSSLKHREYGLRGLPFVYATRDLDFDAAGDYCLRVDEGEGPIDIADLMRFAEEYWRNGRSQPFRQYTIDNCSWTSKMSQVAEFMHHGDTEALEGPQTRAEHRH